GPVPALSAREAVPLRGRPLGEFARDAWSLTALAADYDRFIGRFSPLLQGLQGLADPAQDLAPEPAFLARTLLVHEFRRVQLRDPQLPQALLPGQWPGLAAYRLSGEIYRRLYPAANRHVLAVLEAESGFVPPLTPYFYQRFGGLLNDLA
ncbi:hypothetical protein KXX11_003075, partial [Aspergillus fumigatus]